MKIALIGDIVLTDILISQASANTRRFKEIGQKLNKVDVCFANLEAPIGSEESLRKPGKILLASDPSVTIDTLKRLNISCVSLANNHIFDAGKKGVMKTIGILEEEEITFSGAGWLNEHLECKIINNEGKKIGFLSYVDKSTNVGDECIGGVLLNVIDKEEIIRQVKQAKTYCDYIVLSLHWGKDYSYYPSAKQIEYADAFIEAGVDFVMGHHPHSMQPYKDYGNGKYAFFSLGGLVYGDFKINGRMRALRIKTKWSAIPVIDLKDGSVEFITTRDLKGNFIKISRKNYKRWSQRKMKRALKSEKSSFINKQIRFEEAVCHRIYDVFFGYYRNPIYILNSLKKIHFVVRDFRK